MPPLVDCSGICSNLAMDPANCGSCGTACAPGEACVAGTCETLVCGGAYQGYATWRQTVSSQSDAVQDAAMDSACAAAYSGSRAATIEEITYGCVYGLPSTNTSGYWLMAKCPLCEGNSSSSAVSGHCRKCVNPSYAWPTAIPGTWYMNCCTNTRSCVCIR